LNRIVEDYLRAYCSDEPLNWVTLLPLAQYAYNNSRNSSTGRSPNWYMHGFNCEIRINVVDNVPRGRIPAAKDRVEKLHQLRQDLREKLVQAQERMAKYYKNHVPKQFKVGDLVKLSTKNLRLKHPKLALRWIGLFCVTERIGGQAYRPALPEQYRRLHDVFPIQLIESYKARDDGELMPMPALEDPQDEWEVEEIKGSARIDSKRHYLVKWAGWPSEYNSWEPVDHLENAQRLVTQFDRKRGQSPDAEADRPRERKRRQRRPPPTRR
jgi:hypothetical protein